MSKLFEELVQGLAEVRAYMEGEREGFKVTLPAEVEVKAKTEAKRNKHIGASVNDFLHEEGILEKARAIASKEVVARDVTTDAELDAALEQAKLHDNDPVAKTAQYVPRHKLLIVELTNGRRLALPIEDLLGLENATVKQLQNIEILGLGTGINFPDIDVGFYVPALIKGVYGNRRWMETLETRKAE
jgi:hypothetical protein